MNKRIVISVIIAALIAGGVAWWTVSRQETTNAPTNQTVQKKVQPTPVSYQGIEGQDAFGLLKAAHEVTDDNGFVTSIDGRANTTSFYWIMYVNDAQAQVGAKDYITKSGDQIEWRYEEFRQ